MLKTNSDNKESKQGIIIKKDNPIIMGEFLSTSKEIRKITGFKYLEKAFPIYCRKKKIKYKNTMDDWAKIFDEFTKNKS